jgi:NADH:quinone reductase (non-electrogenic)
MPDSVPRVVIVGGGFGGLAAAKALRRTNAQVILIDRQNHQPVSAAAVPGRDVGPEPGTDRVADSRNSRKATQQHGDPRRRVFVDSVDRADVGIEYDYLILATGASHSYFGHDEFEQFAPGLKSLADAVSIRNRILLAFEQAEAEEDPQRHRDLLTFVLVGAGPTGVEMAGALAVLVRSTLQSEFRRIDPASARIILIDQGQRVLATFFEKLSAAGQRRLEKLGVEVRLGHGGRRGRRRGWRARAPCRVRIG